MVDVATLGLQIDSKPIKAANDDLDKLAKTARATEQAAQGASRGMSGVAGEAQRLASRADDATTSVNRLGGAFLTGAFRGAAIAAVAGIGSAFLNATREIAKFEETSRRAGLNLQRFQELRIGAAAKGVTGTEFDTGVNALAARLNEARQTENGLTRLLDENNVKYKDRKGEVISTNTALEIAAELIKNAATEQDKIKIAEAFGLPPSFISTLENGVAGLREAGRVGRESGGIIDAELVAKAKAFDDAWNATWASWSAYSKASIVSVGEQLGGLVAQAQGFAARLNNLMGVNQDAVRQFENGLNGGTANGLYNDAESRRARGFGGIGTAPSPLVVDLGGRKTRTGSLFGANDNKGGGADKVNAYERETAAIQKQVNELEREGRQLGLSKSILYETEAAQRLYEAAKKAGIPVSDEMAGAIEKESLAYAAAKVRLDELKQAQEASKELQQFLGQSISGFFSDIVSGGKNASEALMNLVKRLADAVLQAALLGNGPLGKLFGGGGGLLGSLFGGSVGSGNAGTISSLFSSSFSSGTGVFANGGIFGAANDNITKFANGGAFTNSIVNSPTLFKFAQGTGLMGEAGPEAIMPLKRGPNGALGVQMHGGGGGGGSVTMGDTNITINGNASDDTVAQLRRELDARDARLRRELPRAMADAQRNRKVA